MVLVFVAWLIMAGVVAMVASNKGWSGFGWFLYGLIIWPVALVHVLVMKPNSAAVEARALASGESRKCLFCAELIKSEAKVCRFCGRDLPEHLTQPAQRADTLIDVFMRRLD